MSQLSRSVWRVTRALHGTMNLFLVFLPGSSQWIRGKAQEEPPDEVDGTQLELTNTTGPRRFVVNRPWGGVVGVGSDVFLGTA